MACSTHDPRLTDPITPVRRGRTDDPTASVVRASLRRRAGTGPGGPGQVAEAGQTRVPLGGGPLPARLAAGPAGARTEVPPAAPQLRAEGGQRRTDLPAPRPLADRRGAEILDGTADAVEPDARGQAPAGGGPQVSPGA